MRIMQYFLDYFGESRQQFGIESNCLSYTYFTQLKVLYYLNNLQIV